MFYCIELQTVYTDCSTRFVHKSIVYKRSPWKGYQIAKLNITTSLHKTTFKKVYKSADVPVVITANKQQTFFTNSYTYVKFVRVFNPLIKHTAELRLTQ